MAKLHANLRGIVALIGDRMYSGDSILTAKKELLQNSFDAIKVERKTNPSLKPKIDIIVSDLDNIIKITDNGCGMTKEVIETAFFGIGSSYKEGLSTEERSGGFGAAKVQFLTFPEAISLTSVKNGVKSSCHVTRNMLLDGEEFTINQEEALGLSNGTTVVLHLDKNKNYSFPYASGIEDMLPVSDILVTYTRNGYFKEISKNDFPYPFIGTAETCFGKLDIYMGNLKSWECQADCTVYSAGIKQFKTVYGSYDRKNSDIIINLRPSVDAHNELYPINNQRQGWNNKVKPEINDLYDFISRISAAVEGRRIKSIFKANTKSLARGTEKVIFSEKEVRDEIVATSFKEFATEETSNSERPVLSVKKVSYAIKEEKKRDSTFKGFDVAFEDLTIDTSSLSLNEAVMYNNTTFEASYYEEFLKDFGMMLLQFRNKLAEDGLARSDQYWGVAFDKTFVGVNVSPRIFDFIGVNPFAFNPIILGECPVTGITEWIIHVMIHELTHNEFRNHNSTFCGELALLYGKIYSRSWFASWRRNLLELVGANIVSFTEAQHKYMGSCNIDESILKE